MAYSILLGLVLACSFGQPAQEATTATPGDDMVSTERALETMEAQATDLAEQQDSQAATKVALQTQIAQEELTLEAREVTQIAQETREAEQVAQATAEAGATQAAVVGELPEEVLGWSVVRADGFSTAGDWWVGTDEDNWVKETRRVEGGMYSWSLYAKQPVFYRIWPSSSTFEDFFTAVDVCKEQGSATTSAGIIFRSGEGGNAYVFMVRNNGRYAFFELVRDTWNARVNWTQATALTPGSCNRVGVLAQGDQFTFYANEVVLDQITDASLDSGTVGLGIELFGGESALWEFDDYVVLAP
jgi:hypothetical protein